MRLATTGCSTFVLRDGETFLIGHNLDETFHVPGMVVFNKRGIDKSSRGLMEWVTGRTPPTSRVTWTSRYGSLTFDTFGRDLPDGGVNEAGLYVQEMTLVDTQFPAHPERPQMFMVIWMQYVLDTCATVDEALATLETLAIDGWSWHFLLCDRQGSTAVVEFPEGETVIRTGDAVPVPVLCNTLYADELENLKQYQGYGGDVAVDPDDKTIERFVHATHMVDAGPDGDPVDYAFRILETLIRGGTQWSYVIDVANGRAYFRTAVALGRKSVALDAFDHGSDSPAKVLDIDADLEGDVTDHFVDWTPELNQALAAAQIANLDRDGGFDATLAQFGNTMENLIGSIAGYAT